MPNTFIERLMDVCPETALKAYLYACRLSRADGSFFVSHATLAKKLGLKHKASGQRAMKLLVRSGLVRVVSVGRRADGGNLANNYKLTRIETVDIEKARRIFARGLSRRARGVGAGGAGG